MKIKKSKTMKVQGGSGGVAINDRLRLDPVAPQAVPQNGTISKKAATVAFVAGLVSLAIVGILVYVLYDHWEFLKGA